MAERARRRGRLDLVLPVAVLAAVALLVVLAPVLAPDPDGQDLAARLAAPSAAHPLGTDELGRDVLSRILHGGRFSLAVALVATMLSLAIGVTVGLVSAVRRGWVDEALTRVNDLLIALPEIVVALLVVALLGPGIVSTVLAVSLMAWTPTARLVRSLAVETLATDYVEASRHLGRGTGFVLRRHVLPALAGPVSAQLALRFGLLLVMLGGLSYLGIGVQPPQSDWGSMLASSQPYAARAPWAILAPGAAIFVVAFCVTLVGDAVARRADPRRSGGRPVSPLAGTEAAHG